MCVLCFRVASCSGLPGGLCAAAARVECGGAVPESRDAIGLQALPAFVAETAVSSDGCACTLFYYLVTAPLFARVAAFELRFGGVAVQLAGAARSGNGSVDHSNGGVVVFIVAVSVFCGGQRGSEWLPPWGSWLGLAPGEPGAHGVACGVCCRY